MEISLFEAVLDRYKNKYTVGKGLVSQKLVAVNRILHNSFRNRLE